MRFIASIFLICPIATFGALVTEEELEALVPSWFIADLFSGVVPPPHGVWECKLKAGFDCKWENHNKIPECRLNQDPDRESRSFRIDLESSPFTATIFSEEREPLHYLGPDAGVWTFLHEEDFINYSIITSLNPGKGTFKQTWIEKSVPVIRLGLYGEYVQLVGTCTNKILKNSGKPTQ
jgi:hypothetical protein